MVHIKNNLPTCKRQQNMKNVTDIFSCCSHEFLPVLYIYIYIYIYKYIYICMYIYIYIYIYIYVCMYVCMYVCVFTAIY